MLLRSCGSDAPTASKMRYKWLPVRARDNEGRVGLDSAREDGRLAAVGSFQWRRGECQIVCAYLYHVCTIRARARLWLRDECVVCDLSV